MSKKHIVIVFGGLSPEYGVSLKSAYSVITHVNQEVYDLSLIGITKEGEWFLFSGDFDEIMEDTWQQNPTNKVAFISPCRGKKGLVVFEADGSTTTIHVDAIMPVLHGRFGEDGTIQGIFEMAGIPIVGCKTAASALCMDKDKSHTLVAAAGIRAPISYTIRRFEHLQSKLPLIHKIGYPIYVKPVKAGSSYGISKVYDDQELFGAVKLAFGFDDEVIMEENIEGFEIGCSIIGDKTRIIGEIDEIELEDGFFDFKEKYTLETSAIHTPARISRESSDEAKRIAEQIYQILGCTGLARVDMFLQPNGEIVFNEVNTIPGFTPFSRFPRMLAAIGMDFTEVVNTTIAMTLKEAEVK